jgi:hypothetical protein
MNLLQTAKQKLPWVFEDKEISIALLVFLIQMFFSLGRLFPTFDDINLWDEAVYINTGRLLVNGVLTPFAHNPLIGVLYAFTYLPFMASPYWLMQSSTLGRILLFILLWWSGYLIARRFAGIFRPLIWVGLLFSTTMVTDILFNSSDSLFAAMSALAFWKLMTFYENRKVKEIGWASFFVGLAALSRNDGLVLFPIFVVISLFFLRSAESKWKNLLFTILPFLALVGGYLLLYRLVTGSFMFGTTERSYVAFQQGEITVYQGNPACPQSDIHCAVLEAQALYGTPQENNNSILTAISRNPRAFLARVVNTIRVLPGMIYSVYGKREAYLLFLFAFLGIYELLKQRRPAILGMLLAWTAYMGVYFFTFFKDAYLETPYFILFLLTAIGIQSLISSLADRRLFLWSAILVVLTGIGIARSLSYLYFDTLILLGMIWVSYLISKGMPGSSVTGIYLIFLAGGLILRGSYQPPQVQPWGQIAEEKAVLLLQQRLPQGSLVGSAAPGEAYAARMDFYGLEGVDPSINTVEQMHSTLVESGVKAVFVDSNLIGQQKYEWGLIEPGIGKEYEQIFSGNNGSVRVLLVNP